MAAGFAPASSNAAERQAIREAALDATARGVPAPIFTDHQGSALRPDRLDLPAGDVVVEWSPRFTTDASALADRLARVAVTEATRVDGLRRDLRAQQHPAAGDPTAG